ncbi:hypothetical protein D1007_21406 [Hordeum vulgare]|nr:hypothetical protein D1007_21406 [Hordeum vulgare]
MLREIGDLSIMDLHRFGVALRLWWLCLERTTLERPWIGLPVACSMPERLFFTADTTMQVCDRKTGCFWLDCWLQGEAPLNIAPDIFLLARRKIRSVHEALLNERWIKRAQGRVTTDLLPEFVDLWSRVTASGQLSNVRGKFSYSLMKSGQLSMASAGRHQFLVSPCLPIVDVIWKKACEIRVKYANLSSEKNQLHLDLEVRTNDLDALKKALKDKDKVLAEVKDRSGAAEKKHLEIDKLEEENTKLKKERLEWGKSMSKW